MRYDRLDAAVSEGVAGNSSPRLLDEVRKRLRLKRYSVRTEQAYLYWIRRYIRESGMRHPRELNGLAVEGFLSKLATRDHVAASTQNQALAALLFLYRDVLAIELPWMENVVRAKRPPRLPVVLAKSEVTALLRGIAARHCRARSADGRSALR